MWHFQVFLKLTICIPFIGGRSKHHFPNLIFIHALNKKVRFPINAGKQRIITLWLFLLQF